LVEAVLLSLSVRQLTMEVGGVKREGEFLEHTRLLLQDSKPLPIDLNLSAW
jgi:hypothetical protein